MTNAATHASTRLWAALGLLLAGCAGPVGTAGRTSASKSSTKTASSQSVLAPAAAGGAAGVTPVSRMTVQSESVEATDLWRGHRDELAEKHKSLSPEEFRNYVANRAAELITDKIAEMLLYQKASLRQSEETGKKIDAYVDGEMRKVVTAEHDGRQRRYEKHLESQGSTLDAARADMRRQFVIAGYLETEIRPKVAEPTRADLLAAFQAGKDSLRRPARWSMSLIDIRVADLLPKDTTEPTREQSQAARAEARSKVAAALAEIRNGTPFADVARRYSHDSRAADGGAWGWVNPDSVRERYRPAVEALQKLTTGRVSEPIETPEGCFIVRCDQHEPAVEPDFTSVQPQLREIAMRQSYNQMITDLIAELRDKARLEPANLEQFHAAVVIAAYDGLGPVP